MTKSWGNEGRSNNLNCESSMENKMDDQKVTQVLKQIFDIYGVEAAYKQSGFKAAVFDLLPELQYKDERIVLRNAIETDALLPLLTDGPVTADAVAQAEERLKKSAHMADVDAQFVIRCFLAARGQNPESVIRTNSQPEAVQITNGEEAQNSNRETAGKEQHSYQTGVAETSGSVQQGSIFEVECKRQRKEGKLCLYKDKLVFNQYMKKKQIEINYDSISKIRTHLVGMWLWYFFCIYGIGIGVVCATVELIFGMICIIVGVGGLIYGIKAGRRSFSIRIGFTNHLFLFKNSSDRNCVLDRIQNEVRR